MLKPLAELRSSPDRSLSQIVPVWRWYRRKLVDGGSDIDWVLFPLLFGGNDVETGPYFAVFPLGGRIKGLLGHEVMDFALFPLFARFEQKGRDSYSFLWPIFNIVDGGGWSGGRVFPFFSSYRWNSEDGTPRARRFVALWPLWIENDIWWHDEKTVTFFSFPFYGKRENSRSTTTTWLWPFFVTYHDKRHDTDLVGGYFFPYRFGEHQDSDYFDPWPLFGLKESARTGIDRNPRKRFRQFAIWPIQRYEESQDTRERSVHFWFLPFYWNHFTADLIEGGSKRKWKLWPLVGYERDRDELMLESFSPLWLHRKDWDRFYGRIFALFRYRSTESYSGWELLWGTLYWGRGDPTGPTEKPETADDVARVSTERDESKEQGDFLFSVLGGLFEYGSDGDKLVLRFLWIPWW